MEGLTDNYAPNWLPFYSPEGEIVPGLSIEVECAVCNKDLAVTKRADRHNDNDNDNCEPFTILPCGHAFGYDCIEHWMSTNEENASCPSCRKPLTFACGHQIQPHELEFGRVRNMKEEIECCIVQGALPACPDCERGAGRGGGHRHGHGYGHRDRDRRGAVGGPGFPPGMPIGVPGMPGMPGTPVGMPGMPSFGNPFGARPPGFPPPPPISGSFGGRHGPGPGPSSSPVSPRSRGSYDL